MKKLNLKARRFTNSEYGFNYFCIVNPNYKISNLDEVVIYNDIKCFELNHLCFAIERLLSESKDSKINQIRSFQRVDGKFVFYNNLFEDITEVVPEYIIRNIMLPTSNVVYRYRYIINENMVLVRRGLVKINNKEYDISDDYIMTVEAFKLEYKCVPNKNYSFIGNFE
ncbi:MAG: hypothetical protein DRG78_00910 [Epsilonproteobacteria bacterium]|nr:MAG: hypothetical protein DRG78_00910 [Campylobacterota bacterium]